MWKRKKHEQPGRVIGETTDPVGLVAPVGGWEVGFEALHVEECLRNQDLALEGASGNASD